MMRINYNCWLNDYGWILWNRMIWIWNERNILVKCDHRSNKKKVALVSKNQHSAILICTYLFFFRTFHVHLTSKSLLEQSSKKLLKHCIRIAKKVVVWVVHLKRNHQSFQTAEYYYFFKAHEENRKKFSPHWN